MRARDHGYETDRFPKFMGSVCQTAGLEATELIGIIEGPVRATGNIVVCR